MESHESKAGKLFRQFQNKLSKNQKSLELAKNENKVRKLKRGRSKIPKSSKQLKLFDLSSLIFQVKVIMPPAKKDSKTTKTTKREKNKDVSKRRGYDIYYL